MSDERDDTIVLTDDDGNENEFEYITTIEMDDNEYVILLPVESEENTDEVVILRVEPMDDGEDALVSLEDEQELQRVFEEFKKRMEEEYEFEE